MKRLEKLGAKAASGAKRKKGRASVKFIKGVVSAAQHELKDKETRGFDDQLRTSGARPIGSDHYAQVRFNTALGKEVAKGRGKERGKSLGGVAKAKGKGEKRSKSSGGCTTNHKEELW